MWQGSGGQPGWEPEDPERVLELALDLVLMERGTTGIGKASNPGGVVLQDSERLRTY